MSLYEPTRGGNRGGKDQFAWEDVKSDKYRENYLAHSLMAPVGRWQKGRDLTWYTKESKVSGRKEALKNEVAAVKRAEEEAMALALGQKLPAIKSVTPGTSNLSKRELIDVCRRRSSEGATDTITGREIIEGIGYKSQKRRLLSTSNQSEEGVTSFEREGDKDSERLVLQRKGERERLASSEFGPTLPPETSTSLAPSTTNNDGIAKKEKHKQSRKKKKKSDKKSKKESKSRDHRKRKRKEATPTTSDSSDDDDDTYLIRKKGKHRHHGDYETKRTSNKRSRKRSRQESSSD